jgi:archaea-specific RecJ-like exonuclease
MKQKRHKNKDRSRNQFTRNSSAPAQEKDLGEITIEHTGKTFSVKGVIDRVAQTAGPTLFSITDGTGSFILKGFEAPGERAYPDIVEGDAIKTTIKVNEFNGSLEGEIIRIIKLDSSESQNIHKQIEEIERKRATPEEISFMIKSPILDKLKERFIKAATEIRLAVLQNRPIIVRHHNDTDGYSSGFSLERAIIPLIEKQHGPGKAPWEFYSRAPCAAPFYEIDDSIRDTANSLRNEAKFSNKMPLIIIADNGSSPEDLMAIKQGKVHGIDFIVVDHHQFEKDVISSEVLVHISPFLVGESGSHFSAGMLCTELARFINSAVSNISQIPAMAGLADRIDLENPEAVEAYLKIAKEEGYSKELLADISTVIDFVSAKLRFMEAREYIEVLFGEPRSKQKDLVKLLAPYIRKLEEKGLEIAKSAAKIEKINSTTFQTVLIDEAFPGFGFYPKPGKAIGLVHDYLQENKKLTNVVSAGILGSAITMRATDEANFSVHELINFLHKKMPEAFVEGGGHKNAGSITFIPNKQQEIVKLLKEFIKKR